MLAETFLFSSGRVGTEALLDGAMVGGILVLESCGFVCDTILEAIVLGTNGTWLTVRIISRGGATLGSMDSDRFGVSRDGLLVLSLRG